MLIEESMKLCKKERIKGYRKHFFQTYLTDLARCQIGVTIQGVYKRRIGKNYYNARIYYDEKSYPAHLVMLADGNMQILDMTFSTEEEKRKFVQYLRDSMRLYCVQNVIRFLLQIIYYVNVPIVILVWAKAYLVGQYLYIPLGFMYLLFFRYLYVKNRNM